MLQKKIRPIAIHLPQFHPIPENDKWWGKGFTEWTNVTKAKPLFEGHYQPHLPADLGFYDLRLPEARQAQADLAREYGIYGFCYYHYWFNGRRILERPVQEILDAGKPDFPFMLCWANENWTRVWDGGEKDILLEQVYSAEDDLNHIKSLIPFFKDARYIRINNKPVFAVYKSALFPDMRNTIQLWRQEAARQGLELYLCRFERASNEKESMDAGFDAAIEFQPQAYNQPNNNTTSLRNDLSLQNLLRSIRFRTKRLLSPTAKHIKLKHGEVPGGSIASYENYIKLALQNYQAPVDHKLYRGVCPGWDNSSRRKSGYAMLHGSTPELFGEWTTGALKAFQPYSPEENLFFINAWNEWAEGNHLEPCQKWGRAYLEVFKKTIDEYNTRTNTVI